MKNSNIKSLIADVFAKCIRLFIKLLGKRFTVFFAQKLQVDLFRDMESEDARINFYTPNELTDWRVVTLFDKEPETISWIESFDSDEVLWDIGANIGIYSIYAAVVKGCRVVSFEPSAGNYYALCKNIELNGLDDRVTALCLALNDQTCINTLNLTTTEVGGALSNFAKWGDDAVFRQSCIGFSADDLIDRFNLPLPNYIKLDVDGIEDLVLHGASSLLASSQLKAILVELDEDDLQTTEKIRNIIEQNGMRLQWKKHSEMFESGTFSSVYNNLFVK